MKPKRTTAGPLRQKLERCARLQWGLLGGAIVILGGFYASAHRPAARRMQETAEKIAAVQAELAACDASGAGTADAAADDAAALQKRLKNSRPLTGSYGSERFVRSVAEACQEAGLRKLAVQSGAVRRSGPVAEVPVMLRFEGDFLDVCSFLRQAELSAWLTRVKGLQVRTTDASRGQVEVELSLKAYSAASLQE